MRLAQQQNAGKLNSKLNVSPQCMVLGYLEPAIVDSKMFF